MRRSNAGPAAAVLLTALLASACSGAARLDQAAPAAVPPSPAADARFAASPTWHDEFDYEGLPDPDRWAYDTGGDGWGNNELQHYTTDIRNAAVGDGVLRIVARRENAAGRDYSSARLVSRGRGDFRYGRFEIRARLPEGRGTWPAIWMLPTDQAHGGWPASGEIDIMEHVGHEPGRVHVSVHTAAYNHKAGTHRTGTTALPTATRAFHRYRVDWTPDAIRGYIDDAQVYEFTNEGTGSEAWPFDQRFHLLLNVAVGGDWGGQQGVDDAAFPATLEIDYVRVYRLVDR